jgi:cobalt-precorrin-5B (C1)-methyltransferase
VRLYDGSCAAAAAKACAIMLLTGKRISEVSITTPQGIVLTLGLHDIRTGGGQASCAVQKFSGDDPDVTDGALIYATVTRAGHGSLRVDGGAGVGRVTRPGWPVKLVRRL